MCELSARLFQGRVVPRETKESIRLPDLEGPYKSGNLESGSDHSAGLRAQRHFVTSHELLATLIAGSVPSGNR
jgi:hypothetical protein